MTDADALIQQAKWNKMESEKRIENDWLKRISQDIVDCGEATRSEYCDSKHGKQYRETARKLKLMGFRVELVKIEKRSYDFFFTTFYSHKYKVTYWRTDNE